MREGAEKQHCAAHSTKHHKAPQLPAAPIHEKGEDGGACCQTIGRVQRGGQSGQPQPKGAQQIVQQPDRQPQQDGLAEDEQLVGDLIRHTEPNRRLKNPPRAGPWSS